MKTTQKRFVSRFEKIRHRLNLDFFRNIIRDNAFAMEYNYLPVNSAQPVTDPYRQIPTRRAQ